MHLLCLFVIVASVVEVPDIRAVRAQVAAPYRDANNFVCGPRCVQRVLQHYGRQVELIDLVRELQGNAVDHAAHLGDMQDALQRRGVYAVGVKLQPADMRWLAWEEPVIAHFAPDGKSVGHFQVMLPSAGPRRARVWDGLAGESLYAANEFAATASGVVLLTSASPIVSEANCLSRRRFLLPLCAVVIIVSAVTFLIARTFRSAHSMERTSSH